MKFYEILSIGLSIICTSLFFSVVTSFSFTQPAFHSVLHAMEFFTKDPRVADWQGAGVPDMLKFFLLVPFFFLSYTSNVWPLISSIKYK